jgi:signal transduction histidine kinase
LLENFASGLAHEIGNPLAAMRTTAQSIQEDYETNLGLCSSLDRIISEIDRLHKIVKDFNMLGKPSPPDFSYHALSDIWKGISYLIDHNAQQQQITVITEFEEILPHVWVDAQQIQQVILNLVINAFQAMSSGGTLIAKITAVLRNQQNLITLSITDNGPGIAEEHLDHIFDPFFTTKSTGTGFGLSLVQSIMRQNGGSIQVTSRKGKGSAFTLFFPISLNS